MVPREVVRRASLVKRISATRKMVSSFPGLNSIQGVPVTLEELSAAESTLLGPESRILEELLVHETETRDLRGVRSLMAEAREMMPAPGSSGVPVRPEALKSWLLDLLKQCLDEQEGGDPEFGSLETGITPPFGEVTEVE